MASIFPLSEAYRDQLVERLSEIAGAEDPLSFIQKRIFKADPRHAMRIPTFFGRPPAAFYLDVIRYCELSAWCEDPALIISLLQSFEPLHDYRNHIHLIVKEGPYRCHPPGLPFHVCRVAAELPLIGRLVTRTAAARFETSISRDRKEGKRVLRVRGPHDSGKSYTLKFFRYLAAIRPLKVHVIQIDFADTEMVTQAAAARIPIELYIAQQLEAQVRRRRAEDTHREELAGNSYELPALELAEPPQPYPFEPLTDLQQRTRWAKELANDFVNKVLYTIAPELMWIAVFDNCEKASPDAQEFVRRLVEHSAGVPGNTDAADRGLLRVVLLGESDAMVPNPVYENHLIEEDLSTNPLGPSEVKDYFVALGRTRRINLSSNQIDTLTQESVTRAQLIIREPGPPPWPRALAIAALEKSLPLEAIAAKIRSDQ